MLTAALVCCLQSAAPRIDVREPAAIGSVMAKRLSEVFGVKVTADASIADEPLIVSVKGVTFEEFRALSAEGLDASWREVTGGWQIYRSPKQIADEESQFIQARADAMRKEFHQRESESMLSQEGLEDLALRLKIANDEELEEILYSEEVVSSEVMLRDVWSEIGLEYFIGLPLDRRYVYTSDGRKGTRKHPALAKIVKAIETEQARTVEALKKSGAWARIQASTMFTTDEALDLLCVGKAEFVVLEVSVTSSEVALALSGFDEEGNSTVGYYDSLSYREREPSTVPSDAVNGDVTPSEAAKSIHSAIKTIFEGESGFGALIEILAALPDRDVLSYDVSDILLTVADKSGRPLFGRLSDDMASTLGFYSLGGHDEGEAEIEKIPLRTGVVWLDNHINLDFAGAGPVKVTPDVPPRFQTSFPRHAIGDYVRANRGSQLLDLGRLPRLMVPPRTLEAESFAEGAFVVHETEEMLWGLEFSLLATWAGLTPVQRNAAISSKGISIPLSQCGEALRHDFQYAAVSYGQWSMLVGSREGEEYSEEVYNEPEADWLMFDVGPKTLDSLQMNIRGFEEPLVLVQFPDEQPTPITAQGLAEWAHSAETDDEGGESRTMFNAAKFGVEQALRVVLRYETPSGNMVLESTVPTTANGPKGLSLAQLPRQFLAEFRAALAELRKGGG